MRNLFGTAVAVILSMVLLPACCSTANAGVAVSVSVGATFGSPGEDYVYEECDNEVMDWDNVYILNDNLIGVWVLLPGNHWVLRCRTMVYNSATLEWTFGPWWYNYSILYGSSFRGVRFHTYMIRHYPTWHKRYFVYTKTRYVPRVERHIVVHRGRYVRHHDPIVKPLRQAKTVHVRRPVTTKRTTIVTRETKGPVRIDGGKRSKKHDIDRGNRSIKSGSRSLKNDGSNKSSRIDRNKNSSKTTTVTRTRTTTRKHSNGKGVSSTRTRSDSRSTTKIHRAK